MKVSLTPLQTLLRRRFQPIGAAQRTALTHPGLRVFRYRYDVNKDIGFDLQILEEVGGPWQAEARRQIDDILGRNPGWSRKSVELPGRPWVVDALVKDSN